MENNNVKALLVGVSDYSQIARDKDLYGDNDVMVLSNALNKGLKIPYSNIRILGLASRKVNCNSFVETLKQELSKINGGDTFIFYFSGHGGIDYIGNSILYLSDGSISSQELISVFDESLAGTKIVLIDACHAGSGGLTDNSLDEEKFATSFMGKGTIVMASCRKNEESTYLPNVTIPVSVYTSVLSGAFTSKYLVRNGYIAMEDIARHVSVAAEVYNRKYSYIQQTPIYYSNIIGDVRFHVEEYHPYNEKKYYSENEDYIVYNVENISTASTKRYSAKIILKHPADITAVADISSMVVNELKYVDVYKSAKSEIKWKGKNANIIFMYWGYDEIDMDGNFAFISTWAETSQDRAWFYKDKTVINDIGIKANNSYDMLRKFTIENTANKDDLIKETRHLLNSLINAGNELISKFRAFLNAEFDENSFIEKASDNCNEIDRLYFEISNLDISPIEISRWTNLCMCVACDISNMSLYYNAEIFKKRTADNRKACMEVEIKHYQQDLIALKDEEKRLGFTIA